MQADEANQAGDGEWNKTPETWARGVSIEPPQDYASGPEFPQEPPQGAYEWFTTDHESGLQPRFLGLLSLCNFY